MKTNEQLKAENEAIRAMLADGPKERLLTIPGVFHVSVGLKETNAKLTDQLCIRVYVKEKKDKAVLPVVELIPKHINGIPTDVNVVGRFEFSEDNTRYRPIKGGILITNRIIAADTAAQSGTQMERGTLGCIAIDNTDNSPVLLTNWHVLYANTAHSGDKVYQPFPFPVPRPDPLQLPLRPNDDAEKIGVIRQGVVNNRVDAAIAAIDVSSCCHCCGIHYSNEINGLSIQVNGQPRPPRNTIIGDERAVSGMKVFKVGQATGRTEGVVLDDDYPTPDITQNQVTYSFTGQIAIQNVDPALPFSDKGDSGSVIINLENKIVGLLFASGKKVKVKDIERPFVTIANHISDVLSALNIRIPYSEDVKVIAGETLIDVPASALEAPIPEPYRALRERLQSHEVTAKLFAIGQRHSEEITYLVNHCRPVTIAWRRSEGPAFLATVMGAVRDGHYQLPQMIKGVTPYELLERMRLVLSQHGSAELRETMISSAIDLREIFRDCDNLNDLIDQIATDHSVVSLLGGVVQ